MNIRSLSTKVLMFQDIIVENKLDILGLCETWLKPEVYLPLNKATPPNYISSQLSRESKKGGGVALISNSKLVLKLKNNYTFSSFEVLAFCSSVPIKQNKKHCRFILFSHTLPAPRPIIFVNGFSEFAADLTTYSDIYSV